MADLATVRHRLVDDTGQDRIHQLEAHLLSNLAAEPSVRGLAGLEQPAGREPPIPRQPPDLYEHDVSAAIMDEAAGRPERRSTLPAKGRIVRCRHARPTEDRDATELREGVGHPILALSGTHGDSNA